MRLPYFLLLSSSLLLSQGCNDESEDDDLTSIDSLIDDIHDVPEPVPDFVQDTEGVMAMSGPEEDCLVCHHPKTEEDIPIFYLAGTIKTSDGFPQTEAVVNIYAKDTNRLLASYETDHRGTFSTTEVPPGLPSLDNIQASVDVEVVTPNGIYPMPFSVSTGACNACHSKTTDYIRAD
ncbi:MAG: hypothetical protein AAGB12_14370 [Pseudomonadota bacterium]